MRHLIINAKYTGSGCHAYLEDMPEIKAVGATAHEAQWRIKKQVYEMIEQFKTEGKEIPSIFEGEFSFYCPLFYLDVCKDMIRASRYNDESPIGAEFCEWVEEVEKKLTQ